MEKYIKRNHASVRFFAVILALTLAATCAFGAYSGGTGEPNNPYQIATRADLLVLGANTADYGKCFILTADIDLDPNLPGGQVFTTAIIAKAGGGSRGFAGTFDGSGHKITHLTINGGTNYFLGLFGAIDMDSIVKNLCLENCSVSGYQYVGGLAGFNGGNISNCYLTGTISGSSGSSYVGGLVGGNWGSISNCCSTGSVSGHVYVGGLVGYCYYPNFQFSISNCYSAGAVSGTSNVGGLVGYSKYGIINDCYSTSSVSSASSYSAGVGGLVGQNYYGAVSNCYSTGDVSGYSNSDTVGGLVAENLGIISSCYSTGSVSASYRSFSVGGLVGRNHSSGSINNCYSTGSVTCLSRVKYTGGLVGDNAGIISNCYSRGTISGSSDSYYVGGLMGVSVDTVTSCFWDTQTSGQIIGVGYGASEGVSGKTTVEMKTLWTFTSASWDFNTPVWAIIENVDYPHLWWENTAPLECGLKITPQTINRKSNQPNIQAVLELPDGIALSDVDTSEPLVLYPGAIKAAKQSILAGKEISADFNKDALMAVIAANGNVELKVAGKLKSGQCFYGADTVRMIH